MAFNILEHVALAYQPIWGRTRQLIGVRLRVRALQPDSVDAAHLLHWLATEWSAPAPFLLVSFADAPQLLQALAVPPVPNVWLEIPDYGDFLPPDLQQAVERAKATGHALVQGAPLDRARPLHGQSKQRYLLDLWPEQAALALTAASQRRPPGTPSMSPVLPDQLYQNIGSRALAAHCLDDQRAWGICGWPQDDTLFTYRQYGVQPDRLTLVRVQLAVQNDASMDVIEDLVHQDVVLTYRLLRLVNSVVFGGDRQINTIRQALMLLGQRQLREWLHEQLGSASTDKDLLPVRQSLVLRARLMEYLMAPGPEHDLQAEIYITGLFSQLDQMMQEPIGVSLGRVPLSERIVQALLLQEGPYYAYLDLAQRLENFEQMEQIANACAEYGFAMDTVNRALLRMLVHWRNTV